MSAAHPMLRLPLLSLGLVSVLSACPTTVTPQPLPEKPQVAIHMPVVNVVGEALSFTVTVSGCESLRTLEIYDGSRFIKSVPPQLPQTAVTVQANELEYSRGFALSIAFRARAVCSDGRENLSRAQAATYMPVEQVYASANGEQLVTDLFTVEGRGEDVTFIGCTWNTTYSQTTVVRVDLTGAVVDESLSMPFRCTHGTVFTEPHPVTGKRWLWDREGGAAAMDSNLVFSGQYLGSIDGFMVEPGSGDGLVMPRLNGTRVRRIRHNAPNTAVWAQDVFIDANLYGTPAVSALGLVLPLEGSDLVDDTDNTLSVSRIDLNTGAIVSSTLVLNEAADAIPYSDHEGFTMTVKEDGSRVYMPRLGSDGRATIRACSTEVADCSQAPGLLWESTPHEDWPTFIQPYANGSRILVASASWAMVLDGDTGQRIGNAFFPTGALGFSGVVLGRGEAFYLLTSPQSDGTSPLATGVVAVDDPALGPVFRYSVNAGTFGLSVDEDGVAWMRLGARLAKALPLSDYREALQSGGE
jgi:hypothetical protein